MKAITYSRYGPPDVLQLKDVEKPQPKDNEVLIKVQAVEVTKSDCEMRSFKICGEVVLAALANCIRGEKTETADPG